MKIIFSLLTSLCILESIVFSAESEADWKGKTLSVIECEKRWGVELFDAKKFRIGDATIRSHMVGSLLRGERYLHAPAPLVEKELGRPDGFFGSERIPAYIVEDGRSFKKPSWQLVFYLDKKGHVSEIFVQENGSDLPYRRSRVEK